jgi:hypothetical protein
MSNSIPLHKEAIDKIDLSPLTHHLSWNPQAKQFFLGDAGQEHYKLLAYLSQHIAGEVFDIGTLFGASALALSINDNSKVLTFDRTRFIPEVDPQNPATASLVTPLSRPNIKMYVASGQAVIPRIAQSPLVVLDVDPHDGFQETDFVERLVRHDFKGILVVNDINLNKEMRWFWENIPHQLKKLDATHLGHHTGTGIIVFDPSFIDVCL